MWIVFAQVLVVFLSSDMVVVQVEGVSEDVTIWKKTERGAQKKSVVLRATMTVDQQAVRVRRDRDS
jgi:hypothetical protein